MAKRATGEAGPRKSPAKRAAPAKKAAAGKTPAAAKKPAAGKPAARGAAPAAAAGGGFAGFPRGGDAFFRELAERQDRDWFTANRERFETLWNRPMHAFVDALAERLEADYPGASQTRRKVFRIHRDVRFGADKSPYKTHAAAVLPLVPSAASETSSLVCYVHLGPDERFAGLGWYELPKVALDGFRKAVAGKAGETLARALDALEARGFRRGSREQLKKVPPGFPQDHPRADLLRRKGLFVHFPTPAKALLATLALVDWFADHARQAKPVTAWMRRHAGV